MRYVVRAEAAPESLIEKGETERQKAALHYNAVPPPEKSFAFSEYKRKEVKDALERLFHGKCAYCESRYANTQPMDVEHYRPKGAVLEDTGHRGYWWIAMKWENLLPSCIDCNRKRKQVTPEGHSSQVTMLAESREFSRSVTVASGKKDSFPLAETGERARIPGDNLEDEKPLLINPCNEDPSEHLAYYFDRDEPISFVVAKEIEGDADYAGDDDLSIKGATSIHVYGLNRLGLVQSRTEQLRRLEFLADLAVDLYLLAQDLEPNNDDTLMRIQHQISGYGDRVVAELVSLAEQHQPYSAMVSAWLKEFMGRLDRPG